MNQHPGIIGIKLGMTQVFMDDGSVVPCTVVQADCRVVGKRTLEKDGYSALILGWGERKDKHTNKAERTAFEKAGTKAPKFTREMRGPAEYVAKHEIGQLIDIAEIFSVGQKVDVQGTGKGHGFTGVMKRHKFKGAHNATHGTHEWRRHGGSIGTNMTPGRVKLGMKMSGQHGNKIVSVLNQKIAKLVPEKHLVLIDGTVPGAPNSFVRVQGAVKRSGGRPKG
jgi:large subunit ribosomal protein L3